MTNNECSITNDEVRKREKAGRGHREQTTEGERRESRDCGGTTGECKMIPALRLAFCCFICKFVSSILKRY